ncbi:21 kDa hemolysin precursor [uncultured Gammaproteobacteria bacterium]|jgi:osmotically-inducible protein OsmY|nr:21 kDa hemolysin precursor [uncultured Gammaproteobacteria bacterium]
MKKIILPAIIITSTLFLSSCLLSSVVSTVIVTSNDRRTAGEILDDNNISFSLLAGNTEEEDKKIKDAHLNYMVYDAEVLVTGEVPNEGIRNYVVTQIPLKDFKISRVIDELRIAPNSGILSRAKDSTITAQIEVLFLNQDVFNPIHVKVMTENRSVYLMGKVTLREANKAAKVASKANGVQRVVKLFHYLKTRPATEIQREKEKKLQAEKEARVAKKLEILEAKKAELRRQIRALDSKSGTNFSPE